MYRSLGFVRLSRIYVKYMERICYRKSLCSKKALLSTLRSSTATEDRRQGFGGHHPSLVLFQFFIGLPSVAREQSE